MRSVQEHGQNTKAGNDNGWLKEPSARNLASQRQGSGFKAGVTSEYPVLQQAAQALGP